MSIYQILENKNKNRHSFQKSTEFKYFIANRHLLSRFPRLANLYNNEENEFNVMRANLLIQGLKNKETIELEIKNLSAHNNNQLSHEQFVLALHERIVDLPHYTENGIRIYMPFFSRAINEIYVNEPEKLLNPPYSELEKTYEDVCIDAFDSYGPELYNSYFTRLVKIGSNGKEYAFFHYDTNTIYFVTDQGRLDNKIVLFDKYIKNPKYNHMLERIKPVVDAYFNNDRKAMVNALKENELISDNVYQMILRKK